MPDGNIDYPALLRLIAGVMPSFHLSAKTVAVVMGAADEIERLTTENAAMAERLSGDGGKRKERPRAVKPGVD